MDRLFNMDRESFELYRAKMSQYFYQVILLVDYIPFLGPMYNATYALNILFGLWTGKWFSPTSRSTTSGDGSSGHTEGDGSSDSTATPTHDDISIEKYRIAREKGLAAIASALIDLFTLCLLLGIMAYACACLELIRTFALVRYVIFGLVTFSVIALTIGSKILTNQWAAYMTRQLDEVHTVSSSMVKSATITASAIEKIVEKTNHTTGVALYRFNLVYSWIENILYLFTMSPVLFTRLVSRVIRVRVNRSRFQIFLIRNQIKNQIGQMRLKLPFSSSSEIKQNNQQS